MGFPCFITRICSIFEIGANDSQKLVPKLHNHTIINKIRGQSRTGPSTSAAYSTPIQDTDLETYYQRLSRRNECLERQVSFASLEHPEIVSELYQIAKNYKDTESDEYFGLSDTSSSS
ncbi:hypothetical protein MKX03_002765 [Papaver bracteatum]|nr:hypothetical protein MKX03_002765 [Papaver bracteatum]